MKNMASERRTFLRAPRLLLFAEHILGLSGDQPFAQDEGKKAEKGRVVTRTQDAKPVCVGWGGWSFQANA
jgi:hypothetical protein